MNKVLMITSIVTAIAVLIYTVFAGLQWWAIRKQGAYASEQVGKMQEQLDAIKAQESVMQEQLVAAKDAAEAMSGQLIAMKEQADTAEQTLRISQRAYVGVKMHPLIAWTDDNKPIVTVIFTNTGHTPARKCELLIQMLMGTQQFDDCKKAFSIDAHTDKSIDCEWLGGKISEVTRDIVNSDTYSFFFEAELRYNDGWDEEQPPVILRYTYNPQTLAMDEFYEAEKRHKQYETAWNNAVDPSL